MSETPVVCEVAGCQRKRAFERYCSRCQYQICRNGVKPPEMAAMIARGEVPRS